MTSETNARLLRIAALISGEPNAADLWTLRKVSSIPCELRVIQARLPSKVSHGRRLRRLLSQYGLLGTCSRLVGGIIGSRITRKDRELLEELFDFQDLQKWWRLPSLKPISVSTLNHAESRSALERFSPDIIVRVSGGILGPHIFSLARLSALNIHHGQAPMIRGMWSIPWGIIEGRSDWIGATVHIIDQGIDTGGVLWRGTPQLAPGDASVDLFFRAHLEAVDALIEVLRTYSSGQTPAIWASPANGSSTYRSAPGIWDWLRFLYLGRGRRAAVLLERGVGC
jgi:Formyl transferase